MNNIVKEFKINQLFDNQNVFLKFDSPTTIYIGENGLGKTTILSTIFYTLSGKFTELLKIDFESIELKFHDDEVVYFTKNDIERFTLSQRRNMGRFRNIQVHMAELIGDETIELLIENKQRTSGYDLRRSKEYIEAVELVKNKLSVPVNIAEREIFELIVRKEFETNVISQIILKLKDILSDIEILYFPTFRRIEEDLSKLRAFSDEEPVEELDFEYKNETKNSYGELIKFGMADVETTIKKLLDEIKETSINSFNQMTAVLLKQYVSNSLRDPENETDIDLNNLEISLNRVGSEVDEKYKKKIMDLTESREIYKPKNQYLLNFIRNLLISHGQLKIIDDKIKKFVEVCNSYLVNKKYLYDASNVTLNIINSFNNKPIPLMKLSSGEKQIISAFSKILLEHKKDYIILFDEPELSLSIEWQQNFIKDILYSNNCNMLICVTHSPFIFKSDEIFDYSKEILDEIEYIVEEN